ncbi:MAG: hypothetical protein IPK82_11690 [Polyangiaceae bacterium]|nr:hypothetical protein [Polyangiaceae bacterium]
MSRLRFVAALAFALAVTFPSTFAHADSKTQVTWTRIDVPDGDGKTTFEKTLKKLLDQAARKASFGKAKKVSFQIKVADFISEQKGDVHRVTCTMIGRIPGGPSAKSRISFGGNPAEKAKLEKQVLTMVANAVVTRLAEIVRSRAAKEAAERDDD